MAARLVALDKCPAVRQVGIREVFRCLFDKLVLRAGEAQAKKACGSVNLCAGLEAGIEGSIHAVRDQEEMGRWEMGNERRKKLKLEDKSQLREKRECKK